MDSDTQQTPRRVGRPLKYENVEELQARIDAYFADCDPHMEEVTEWVQARSKKGDLLKDENGLNYLVKVKHKVMTEQKPYTITGLAVFLGTSRETLREYKERPEFVDSIKGALDRCERFAEHMLFSNSPTGAIFNLKNNYGWKDKTEQELSGPNGSPVTARVEFIGGDGNSQVSE
jgi:hypothetical protein